MNRIGTSWASTKAPRLASALRHANLCGAYESGLHALTGEAGEIALMIGIASSHAPEKCCLIMPYAA